MGLLRRGVPETLKGLRPISRFHSNTRSLAHVDPEGGVTRQRSYSLGQFACVVAFADEAVDSVRNKISWSADIGNDDRQPACLGFEDHVAKGVGRAREDKEIGGSVGASEVLAVEIASENGIREKLFHLGHVGAIADEEGANVRQGIRQSVDGCDYEIEVFFL